MYQERNDRGNVQCLTPTSGLAYALFYSCCFYGDTKRWCWETVIINKCEHNLSSDWLMCTSETWTIITDKQLTHPCVCNYTSGYKTCSCIPLKTMAALAVLEDIVNGVIRRERVLRDRDDLLAHDDNWLISRFEGNPPGTVRRAAAGVGAQHIEEPCAACATGDVHTGV